MSFEHIRASLTAAELADANAAYTEAMRLVAAKNETLSARDHNDPVRATLTAHIRALEVEAEAAFELAVLTLAYAKAAAASRSNSYDYLAR
ncbi:hypothetical protein [Bosea sp. (in: a-proteobacteria)]|uniref:hypothetical protein n=1 Tax=Bosea sp. (in: a-proteobacteria) TaxID=1871050 RepID=UPI00273541DE|nr:hypothetical protein [Bosea sp. (in: a-proteobacteria)]MDP3255377.1 hypothetical protein [Bosea sp. (in: a-proteobacteria)]